MLCSFTTRLHNFIWFLIFTFTLYCMPNYELLFPYKIHFGIPEAEAAETTEQPQTQAAETTEKVQADTSETKEPSAKESPTAATAASATSSGGSGSSGQGSPTVSFNVDNFTGAAHLSYPIAAPPGRSGLSPQLSLNYMSSGGNGWIGVGWDLSLGHIQRKGPRKGVPKYDDSKDVYELSLGGSSQELVLIGADEYRLKIEGSLLKIKYNSTGNYWEVWDKSGTKMSFGLTVGSRIGRVRDPNTKNDTYLWGLDRVDDPRTNYMELIYFRDQDANNTYQIYLQKIQYNGQVSGGLSHNHEILFNLELTNRPDPISNYRGGFKALTWKRLTSIEVKTNGNLVRRYQFQYTLSNVKSLLSLITLYGSDNTSSLPPTTFTYQTHTMGFQQQETLWPNPSAENYIRNSNTNGTYTDVIDMNGDGLPDRVVYDRTSPYDTWTVYFNNGSGFGAGVDWPNPSAWDSVNGNYIRNSNTNGTYTDVIDMNGDGLPDRVVYDRTSPYDTWTVYFNNGSGFDAGVDWPNPSAWDSINGNYIRNVGGLDLFGLGTFTDVIDMNGDGLPDRVVYDRTSPYDTWTVYFNNGSGFDAGVNWPNPSYLGSQDGNLIRAEEIGGYMPHTILTDVLNIDGDGLPDRVVYDKTSPYDTWSVYYNKGPVSDLLSKVENGIGGSTEITYAPSTDYANTFLPFTVQTVSSYTNKDGRGNSYTFEYQYLGGLYDSMEVEFRGFQKVTACQPACQGYESITETTFHQDYYKKGKIQTQKIVSKPPQGFTEGHKKEIVNTWLLADTLGGGKFPYLDTATTTFTDQGDGGPYTYSQIIKDVYDIRPSDLNNQTFNLLEEHKNEGSPEEIVTLLEYSADYTRWVFSKITKATVTNSSGTIASRKWMDYNTDGELITEELCRSDTPNTGCASRNPTQNVVTSYQYDPTYKVLNQVTDPKGYVTSITYDSTKTFVYETTKCIEGGNCFTTTTLFDPGTGNLTKQIPPHFQGTPYWLQNQYDVFGRKTLDRVKDNTDPNIPPIVDRGSTSYSYNDFGNPNGQHILKTGSIVIEGAPERTLTLNGATYFDGLGRTYLAMANGPEGKTIATQTQFDSLGRVRKQSNPYFVGETPYCTEFYYDGLSRVTDILKTDGYYFHTDYEGLRKIVSKQVTASDWQSTAYYYDLNQKLVKVGEGFELQGQETFTEYTYDILGNLTQVKAAKDATGNNLLGASITTTMTYDSLMKKRSMTDPDMGYWTYAYDKAGNLISQIDAKNQTITFSYDGLNRLTQKVYPDRTVTYTYDDPAVPYSKGKLTKVSDPSGGLTKEDSVLEFDLMERVKRGQKKIGTDSATFEKGYDSAGRMISIKSLAGSPNEKTYSYEYDVAGDLLYVKDNASGNHLVDYSDFTALGQHKIATFPKPNNVTVKTTYTYDPPTARLKTLITQKLVNGEVTATYQNLDYQQFDGLGSIKILADNQNNITHNYTYDHLNRLTLANGVGTNPYNQSFQYDRIGNITYKSDIGTYIYDYSNRPHAVKSITLNGTIENYPNISLTYNYDNKPDLIKKDGINYVQFTYDGNGERVKKYNYSTGQTILYFGSLYEVRGGVGIIHVFAGNQRVASVFVDGKTQFYHTNHLGSASVVTDQYGERKEQIEYHPFGTYRAVGNINGTYDFDISFPDVFYTFTGQEDDDDLGLYNYGARLYDPVLGRFISPDGIVQAPDDPQTLNRYSYARNNPIIYTDPSGNWFIIDDIINAIAIFICWTGITTTWSTAVTIAAVTFSVTAGAAMGAATSAITGGNIWQGALTGAISGLIFYGAGGLVGEICTALEVTTGSLEQVAITMAVHTVAGSVSGAINSAITGSEIGMGMLTGAVGAGIGAAAGGALTLLKVDQFGYQFVACTVMGGVAGGVASEIYGGNFWQGFAQGAATAAAAFLFNAETHKAIDRLNQKYMDYMNYRLTNKNVPWLKEKPLFGQLMMPALLVGEGVIVTGSAGAAGVYFAPELAALTVKYGTIYILGNPKTWQFTVEFISNVSVQRPATPSQIGGSYAGRAARFLYEEWK